MWLGAGCGLLLGHAGPVLASVHNISFGDPGVEQTLRQMRRLVLESSQDPSVISWAQGIVRFLPERDPDAAADAFLRWVRSNVRYTEDPVGVEVVKTPEAMLRELHEGGRITGDCDDQVVLLSAGLNAVGVNTEFVVVAADPSFPDYSHVLLQYESPRRGWTTLDPIVRGTGPGWFPPHHSRWGVYRSGRIHGSGLGSSGAAAGIGFAVVVGVVAFVILSRRRR